MKSSYTVSQVLLLMHKGYINGMGCKYRVCKRVYDKTGGHVGYLALGPSGKWRFQSLVRKDAYAHSHDGQPVYNRIRWRLVAEGDRFEIAQAIRALRVNDTSREWLLSAIHGGPIREIPRHALNGVKFWEKYPAYQVPQGRIQSV
jgi:hypothetical protein